MSAIHSQCNFQELLKVLLFINKSDFCELEILQYMQQQPSPEAAKLPSLGATNLPCGHQLRCHWTTSPLINAPHRVLGSLLTAI